MSSAYFIAGTDTGVGKTLVAAAMLHQAAALGLSTLGLKPVAAGCESRDGAWVNDDALVLQSVSSVAPDYAAVNPVALEQAIAPHIAARAAGKVLTAEHLSTHCREQIRASTADFVVIEGAGGWQVPLNDTETMADVAAALGLPVILVVGMRLGCLNHALLSAQSIAAAGLPLAGWVANFTAPMREARANVDTLRRRFDAPCLGCIPALGDSPVPSTAARHLDMAGLERG